MHEGHRRRMYDKLDGNEKLCEHEILEILLYTAHQRKNTNPEAHALLDRFGSIKSVFNAEIEELKEVNGVGDGTAHFLRTVGKCLNLIEESDAGVVLKTRGDVDKFVEFRLAAKKVEFLELYFVGKDGKLLRVYSGTSHNKGTVVADAAEISKCIAVSEPYGIIAAHNHVDCPPDPSLKDEKFTREMQIICNLNKVDFMDHVIYSDGKYYSFKDSGLLDKIKRECAIDKVLEWTTNSNRT